MSHGGNNEGSQSFVGALDDGQPAALLRQSHELADLHGVMGQLGMVRRWPATARSVNQAVAGFGGQLFQQTEQSFHLLLVAAVKAVEDLYRPPARRIGRAARS